VEAAAIRTRNIRIAAAFCIALFAFAFVAAPSSCEWGLNAYFLSGVACVLLLFALPLMLGRGGSAGSRIGLAFAFAGAACVTWIAGLFIANVRIMCRLF
jgi:hypothetical protein